jgi:CRP-like cAMP-binding protein
VREQLEALSPQLRGRVHLVPRTRPGQQAAEPTDEDARYAAASSLRWSRAQQRQAAVRLARGGHNMAAFQLESAFDQVRLLRLRAGETLLEAGTTARFVYIPLGEGLIGVPLGGYPPFTAPPWLPVGSTGVIRGAQRNATIYATCDLTLLVIPQAVYLNAWHRPYQRAELVARLEGAF